MRLGFPGCGSGWYGGSVADEVPPAENLVDRPRSIPQRDPHALGSESGREHDATVQLLEIPERIALRGRAGALMQLVPVDRGELSAAYAFDLETQLAETDRAAV